MEVVVDEELKFHSHVTQAVKKVLRMLGIIQVIFTCLDETTVTKLFNPLVSHQLENGDVIWNPGFRCDKLEIEKIQRRVTRMIPSLKRLGYEERLRRLR